MHKISSMRHLHKGTEAGKTKGYFLNSKQTCALPALFLLSTGLRTWMINLVMLFICMRSEQLEAEIVKLEDEFSALEDSFQVLQAFARLEALNEHGVLEGEGRSVEACEDLHRLAKIQVPACEDAYAGLPCTSPVNLLGAIRIEGEDSANQVITAADALVLDGSERADPVADTACEELHAISCVAGGNIWMEAGMEGNPAECKRDGADDGNARHSPIAKGRSRVKGGRKGSAPTCVLVETEPEDHREKSKWGVTLALPAPGQPRRVTPSPSNLKRSPSSSSQTSESSVSSWARMLGHEPSALEAHVRYRTLYEDGAHVKGTRHIDGYHQPCSPASEQGTIRCLPSAAANPRTRNGWQGQSWRWWSAAAPVGAQGTTSPVSPSSPSASAASTAAERAASFTAHAAARMPKCLAKLAAAASCANVETDEHR